MENTTMTSTTKISDDELMLVLTNSFYPGAKKESVKMVLSYCKAAGLDPMQRPVHIVPMYVKTGQKKANGKDDEYAMRDVIMPGIGLYRTQAARTGMCAGISEPEFGEDVTAKVGGTEITYPRDCRVTVKRRLFDGSLAEFTAVERWLENYATAGKDTTKPNAMWARRPYAQLAKCAEAQALRKAFPEVGSQPTAEEMEGKSIEGEFMETPAEETQAPAALPDYSQDDFAKNFAAWRARVQAKPSHEARVKQAEATVSFLKSRFTLAEDQEKEILGMVEDIEVEEAEEGARQAEEDAARHED